MKTAKKTLIPAFAAATLGLSLALTGCSMDTSASSDTTSGGSNQTVTSGVPGPVAAPEGLAIDGGMVAADAKTAEVGAAQPGSNVVTATPDSDRKLIKSASAVLGVDDLTASRASVLSIVDSAGGTVTNEYVYSGTTTPPQPVPMMGDVAVNSTYPYYGYDQYVDITFTVPSDQYEPTMKKIRGVGEVVSVQQNTYDVTEQVVDVDARIEAAQASVDRIEALMDDATNLDEVLRLEQELTIRQSNLDSLVAQQKSLATQTSSSTINVRLVPQDLIDAVTPPPATDPTFWDDMKEAFAKAWSGFAVAIVVTSPLWITGLIIAVIIVTVLRRRKQHGHPRSTPDSPSGE